MYLHLIRFLFLYISAEVQLYINFDCLGFIKIKSHTFTHVYANVSGWGQSVSLPKKILKKIYFFCLQPATSLKKRLRYRRFSKVLALLGVLEASMPSLEAMQRPVKTICN